MPNRLKVLFLCTGNSCRSQMAEGWTRSLHSDYIDAYSAGIEVHGLNERAVKVMAEVGVDISGHISQHLDEFKDMSFDYVITVCDNAHEACPIFPGSCKVIHNSFPDPPRLARELAERGEGLERQLDCYRKVRDEIRVFVERFGTMEN